MSTASQISQQQTRQQLDELDALLQRMLSIPGCADANEPAGDGIPEAMKSDDFAPRPPLLPNSQVLPQPVAPSMPGAPVVHAWRVEVPMGPTGSSNSAASPPLALPVDAPLTFQPTPLPVYPSFVQAPAAPAPYPYSMVFGPPATQPNEIGERPPQAPPSVPSSSGMPTPPWQSPRSAEPPPIPFLLWPIAALNGVFNLVTFLLGPLGTWLRRPPGRNALGWLGILLILAAIGWGVADWYGIEWTK
jgi:hypothetical protein